MGLNKDMQDLINNIKRSMIFYIPKQLFKNLQQKHLDELESVGFLNNLFYINSKGAPRQIVDSAEYVEILSKSKILKANVFELLDLKAKLDNETFHYLINDYFIELDTHIIASDIIRKEAENSTNNYEPQMQGYLNLQHDSLQTHHDDLKQNFGSWESKFELDRLLKVSDLNFKKEKLSIEPKDTLGKSRKPKSKIKATLIKDQEIDHYLLEYVFSVDFSKINEEKQ